MNLGQLDNREEWGHQHARQVDEEEGLGQKIQGCPSHREKGQKILRGSGERHIRMENIGILILRYVIIAWYGCGVRITWTSLSTDHAR